MAGGESMSTSGLQISLKIGSLFHRFKGNVCLDFPWAILRSMRNLAFVVLGQTRTQILRATDITLRRIG